MSGTDSLLRHGDQIPKVMVLGMLQGSGDIETGSPAVHIVNGVLERG